MAARVESAAGEGGGEEGGEEGVAVDLREREVARQGGGRGGKGWGWGWRVEIDWGDDQMTKMWS